MEKLVAYYDGGCPLCSKEIGHYRRIDQGQRVHWVDITSDGDALAEVGLDLPTAMRRLHVREPEGHLVSGVPAFVAIWRRLRGYKYLATLVETLRLTRPLDWAYTRFADWRFRRRCETDACAVDASR